MVTYISDDGAFGGPVSVARGQARALSSAGHDVTLFAASDKHSPREGHENGYTLKLFPASYLTRRLGFAAMTSVSLLRHLLGNLDSFDVVHVHLARDLVTLPSAFLAMKKKIPIVVQTHGMVDRSTSRLALMVDAVLTRRILTKSYRVLSLTENEDHELEAVAKDARLLRIRNGIRLRPLPSYSDDRKDVLFLARMHERKRPVAFVEMARKLCDSFPSVNFVLVGPDEGAGPAVTRAINSSEMQDRISWIGGVNPAEVPGLIRRSKVYVLPSYNEVFPMTILEAFSEGTPVVTTSSLGIAKECRHYGAALVTDGSVDELASSVAQILSSAAKVSDLRRGAEEYLRSELSIDIICERLSNLYEEALTRNLSASHDKIID